jgi:hypothetical protein
MDVKPTSSREWHERDADLLDLSVIVAASLESDATLSDVSIADVHALRDCLAEIRVAGGDLSGLDDAQRRRLADLITTVEVDGVVWFPALLQVGMTDDRINALSDMVWSLVRQCGEHRSR